jgi:hypothetical protein
MPDRHLVVSPGSPNVETVPAMLPNLEAAERDEKCVWCGRTREDHEESRESGAAVPGTKGSRNRVQVDLAQLIVQAAANTGFMVIDEHGKTVPGERGTLGYLEWAAINHPKTYLGLLARVLPYHVTHEAPQRTAISREEALIQLQERGLPIDLLNVLRLAPQPLDPGEDPDPYGLALDGGVTGAKTDMAPKPDGTT